MATTMFCGVAATTVSCSVAAAVIAAAVVATTVSCGIAATAVIATTGFCCIVFVGCCILCIQVYVAFVTGNEGNKQCCRANEKHVPFHEVQILR